MSVRFPLSLSIFCGLWDGGKGFGDAEGKSGVEKRLRHVLTI